MLVLCGCWNVWIDKLSAEQQGYLSKCSIIVWSANYVYVRINYNSVVSTQHRYCNYIYCLNYLLLCFEAPHSLLFRTVCVCCVVNIDSGTAQTAYW